MKIEIIYINIINKTLISVTVNKYFGHKQVIFNIIKQLSFEENF